MQHIISQVFIIVGLIFNFLGCLGLLRMPDLYNRLQASTKCVTLGTCSILFGGFIHYGFTAGGIKCILGIIFILLTAPVSAHALSRASYKSGVKLWEKSIIDDYGKEKI